tara:strand:+ start:3834 stop:4190 length:357 start_codon:yes stop_codon:yes gene_type:complete
MSFGYSPLGAVPLGTAIAGATPGGQYNVAKWFTSGGSVTISLYDPQALGSVPISVTSAACIEIGATGLYVWDASNLSVFPRTYKEYVWTMTNGSTIEGGTLILPYAASRSRINAVLHR